ncbi:hypothetical protein JCM10207_003585 [Rhodosporidiobolus poonsookiae]
MASGTTYDASYAGVGGFDDSAAFPPAVFSSLSESSASCPYPSGEPAPLPNPPYASAPYYTPLSPRSRAHSIASSVSSSGHSSFFGESILDSSGTRPSVELPPARLRPGNTADGFAVELPENGQWSVSWIELVELLRNVSAAGHLPRDHLIAQTAEFVSARIHQDPSLHPLHAAQQHADNVSSVSGNLRDLDFSTHPLTVGGLTEDALYAPVPPPPRRAPPAPIQTAGTFVTPLERAFLTVNPQTGEAGQPSQDDDGLPTPCQPRLQSLVNLAMPLPLSADAPLPAEQPTPGYPSYYSDTVGGEGFSTLDPSASQEPLSLRPAIHARSSRHLRNTSSPYIRRPAAPRRPSYAASTTSASSRDSSVDFSGGSDFEYTGDDEQFGSQPTTSRKGAPRPLRPLNRETESYLWHATKGQLSRVSPGTDVGETLYSAGEGAEIITFHPGSYYKVMHDELDILPCDNKARVNEWLRGQACVESCSFRFEGKRPSVIRQHVVSCKTRSTVFRRGNNGDPLKRLCQLQLEAQNHDQRLKSYQRAAGSHLNIDTGAANRNLPKEPPPTAALMGDGRSDSRSIRSVNSQRSASAASTPSSRGGLQTFSSQSSAWEDAQMTSGSGSSQRSFPSGFSPWMAEQAEHALRGFLPPSSLPASASLATDGIPSDAWLASYGLQSPSASAAQGQHFLPPNPPSSASILTPGQASFLAMDD